MLFFVSRTLSKSKRILLPGVFSKDIKPLSPLLKPSNIVIPLLLVSILSQISDNLKSFLNPKDIQNVYSVKVYSKILSSGFNSTSLSVINSLAKTLGPELENLSVLDISQRILFLKNLQLKVILTEGPSKIDFRNHSLFNPLELMKHRKGLASQLRSVMIANSIFSPNSVVFGVPVASINLDLVLYSAKLIWSSLGLLEEDFDFMLRKDAMNCVKVLSKTEISNCYYDNIQALKILFYYEMKELVYFDEILDFTSDNLVFTSQDNLVLLEKELGFVKRELPIIPKEVFISDKKLDDMILRVALEQHKKYKMRFENIYSAVSKSRNKKNFNPLKNIKLKRFLYEN